MGRVSTVSSILNTGRLKKNVEVLVSRKFQTNFCEKSFSTGRIQKFVFDQKPKRNFKAMQNFLLLYRNGLENAEKIILKLVCTSRKIWIYVDPQGSATRELVFNVYNSILRMKKITILDFKHFKKRLPERIRVILSW